MDRELEKRERRGQNADRPTDQQTKQKGAGMEYMVDERPISREVEVRVTRHGQVTRLVTRCGAVKDSTFALGPSRAFLVPPGSVPCHASTGPSKVTKVSRRSFPPVAPACCGTRRDTLMNWRGPDATRRTARGSLKTANSAADPTTWQAPRECSSLLRAR